MLLAGCRAPATFPSPPSSTRVVLVSYDGMGADDVDDLLRRNVLGTAGLRRLIESGGYARIIPVNPTLTSTAHISIATGATPNQTGIVANTFHRPGAPRNESASGFDVPIDTETLWEAARRQGKRVGAITFPGVDGNGPRRRAEWGLTYSHPVVRSRIVRLERKNFMAQPARSDLVSYSPLMRAAIRWEFEIEDKTFGQDIEVLAIDGTDDAKQNYDSLRVRTGSEEANLATNRWFATSLWIDQSDGRRLYGSWSKLLEFDSALADVVIYVGPISSTSGYPAEYREMIDRQIGFWPGPPDEFKSEDWLERREGVDPETFLEQVRRFSEFFTAATILSMQRMPWDLVLAYQPVIDETEHAWRLMNDRQQWSTPDNRAAGRRVRETTYQIVDDSIRRLAEVAGEDAALLVTADHGLAPVDTSVQVNRLLANWGYARIEEDKLSAQTPWAAYTSGSQTHIYSFENASPEEREALAQRLRRLRAPDGEAIFELVALKSDSDHPNTGDIVAYGFPRFAMSRGLGPNVFEPTRFFGQHGGLNHHREYHTLLAAIGPGVGRWREEQWEQIRIAPYVARLLGIDPPGVSSPASPEGSASALPGSHLR